MIQGATKTCLALENSGLLAQGYHAENSAMWIGLVIRVYKEGAIRLTKTTMNVLRPSKKAAST